MSTEKRLVIGICKKKNKNNEIAIYKARLVPHRFSHISGIDYEETCSLVVDAITLFLIGPTIMRLISNFSKELKFGQILRSWRLNKSTKRIKR